MSLTLAQANKIITTALAKSREAGFRPMCVVVVDEGGAVKASAREDEAPMLRFDIALGKAYAAAGMGSSSRSLLERAKTNPTFFTSLAATAQGKFLAQTGAVVIKNADGKVIGAVGASGSTGDDDEAVCIAGVEAAGLAHG